PDLHVLLPDVHVLPVVGADQTGHRVAAAHLEGDGGGGGVLDAPGHGLLGDAAAVPVAHQRGAPAQGEDARGDQPDQEDEGLAPVPAHGRTGAALVAAGGGGSDRKSTRLNSSHVKISYAVFCLKKKK